MGRAGGGGRSGGGMRSSGGGGVRHSGGHSGGGSRSSFSGGSRSGFSSGSRSGFSSGSRGWGTGSGFSGGSSRSGSRFPGGGFHHGGQGSPPGGPRGPVRPEPVFVPPMHRPPRFHSPRRSGCGGCLGSILILVAVMILWSVLAASCSGFGHASAGTNTANIQTSTIRRERLNSNSLVDVGWYTDNLDWILDSDRLEKGLAYFYKRTGVSPYLYLTEDADGVLDPTAEQLDAFAMELYDALFRDEVHFLVVFQEHDGVYNTRYVCGMEARTVMDDEACEILLDYLDAYYYSDCGEEEYFATSFTSAADRIMDTKVPASVYVTGTAVVIGIGVLVWLVRRKLHAYKGEKAPDGTKDVTEELLENADAQTRFPGNEE